MGQYGWGEVSERELIEAVNTAIDNGVTMFDTADTYGLGKSEETLAKAISSRRDKVVIASKFGVRVENGVTFYDNSRSYIEEALTHSLKRLKTDYIDLYQIHYRDSKTPLSEVVDALEQFKRKGYIRAYGLSNIFEKDKSEILRYKGYFASMQDEYSLAHRENEEALLSVAKELHLTPMTWGSLGQGILTGKYSQATIFGNDDRRSREIYTNFHGEKLLKNIKIVDAMRPISVKHHISIAAVAIRFILDYIPNSVVLVGAKRPSQILGSIESMGWSLDHEDIKVLNSISQ